MYHIYIHTYDDDVCSLFMHAPKVKKKNVVYGEQVDRGNKTEVLNWQSREYSFDYKTACRQRNNLIFYYKYNKKK